MFITLALHYVWWRLAMWTFQALSMFGSSSQSRVPQIIQNWKKRKWIILGGVSQNNEVCLWVVLIHFVWIIVSCLLYEKHTLVKVQPWSHYLSRIDIWNRTYDIFQFSEIKCVILFSSPKLNPHFVWDWLSVTDLMLLLHSSQSFQRLYLWCLAGWVRQASDRDWVHLLWVPTCCY